MSDFKNFKKTPPCWVPSPDEKGGGDTQTAKWHYTLTATLNVTHLTPERVFCGGAASRPEVCVLQPANGSSRKDSASSWAVAVRMAVKGALRVGMVFPTFKRVRTRCGAKESGDLEKVPWCRTSGHGVNAGGPLIGVSPKCAWSGDAELPSRPLAVTSQPQARHRHPHIPVWMHCWVNGPRPAPGGYSR